MSALPTLGLPAHPQGHQFYVPGRAGWKLALCVGGILLFGLGILALWPSLRLVMSGEHAQAIAKSVVKTKPGVPDLVLDDDAQIQAHLEPGDNGYTFWNVFSIDAKDGATVDVRENVGSRLQPRYPLIDSEGLRTIATVYYDPKNPQRAIFPAEMSTWLGGAVLTLAGLACTVICAVLLYWANKPIELPEVPAPGVVPTAPPLTQEPEPEPDAA